MFRHCADHAAGLSHLMIRLHAGASLSSGRAIRDVEMNGILQPKDAMAVGDMQG